MTPAQQALLQKAVRSLQAAKVLNETGLVEFLENFNQRINGLP